jgi:hypothetical protein
VSHGSGTWHLFQSLTPADLKRSSMDRPQPVGRVPPENVATAWNKEVLLCVRDSYLELLQEVQRLRLDPAMSRADPPIGRGLDGTHGIPAERLILSGHAHTHCFPHQVLTWRVVALSKCMRLTGLALWSG